MKLVTRSQWGARAYLTPNGATLYSRSRRGVKVHYLGTAYTDRAHDKCAAYVRQIQAQHMDGNGWSDIGYSFVVCTHGYVFEGRGLKRRNSANGNTALNEQDYAVMALVGSSGLTKPTGPQLDGVRDAIDHCRETGPAGNWLGGHRDGYATACPGAALYAWVQKGAPRPTTKEEDDMPISDADAEKIATKVLTIDGVIDNPNTATAKANPYISAETALRNIEIVARRTETRVAALAATNTELVKTVATLAAGLGDLDPEAIVADLTAAIEGIDIRLDATT
ncbi:N-acetylmuramoyl-L-alanine amidase [Streptomyces sp. NBC_01506]|uniref:N-acetylmuramoyl-L-alanine amidase n=1 Tax=Streptomyces sp. NBC_01506 TaxID=2903887 RepID=UPI003867C18B